MPPHGRASNHARANRPHPAIDAAPIITRPTAPLDVAASRGARIHPPISTLARRHAQPSPRPPPPSMRGNRPTPTVPNAAIRGPTAANARGDARSGRGTDTAGGLLGRPASGSRGTDAGSRAGSGSGSFGGGSVPSSGK